MRARVMGKTIEIPDARLDRPRCVDGEGFAESIVFTLLGQLPGGKDSIQTTKDGRRYPLKRFTNWRAEALAQLPSNLPCLDGPVQLIADYVPGDQRRRDTASMLDALGHLFERAQILTDDSQIVAVTWTPFPMNRKAPQVRITLRAWTGAA